MPSEERVLAQPVVERREMMEPDTPIYFLDHTVEVGQGVPIVEIWEPVVSDDTIYLLLGFLKDFWVFGHCKHKHCENVCRLK